MTIELADLFTSPQLGRFFQVRRFFGPRKGLRPFVSTRAVRHAVATSLPKALATWVARMERSEVLEDGAYEILLLARKALGKILERVAAELREENSLLATEKECKRYMDGARSETVHPEIVPGLAF